MTARRPKENMTLKVRPTEDEVPHIEESSPKRLRPPPHETYEERVAKELRVEVSDLRSVRIEVSDPQWLRTHWLWPLVTDDMTKVMTSTVCPGLSLALFHKVPNFFGRCQLSSRYLSCVRISLTS